MMDSQEKDLEKGMAEEVANIEESVIAEPTEIAEEVAEVATEEVEEVASEATETAEEEVIERKIYDSKDEVLDRIKEIAHGEEAPKKAEVDYLKTVFYKLHVAEREAAIKTYIENGGDPEKYEITTDEKEEIFKAEMNFIKERRAAIFKEQEAEKEANLQKKLAIIEKIKTMVTSPEEANKSYQEFKTLQQEWKEIKAIPAPQVNEVWRSYHLYVEQFYDLLKLNNEAREYDFKKNLEAKTRLCEAAEKLSEETDIISASHQLQKLHQEYREVGPVAKELREEIWSRFKAASTVINKRHQAHFEELRAREEDNLNRKTALCEKVEAILAEENKGSADWERHTKEIKEVQDEWKTIGFAPQKMNVKIYERYRAACDEFFSKKTEFFKQLKDTFKENIEQKRALIERAKELKDSTEWKAASEKLIALQKEWKTIGSVPKKIGDQLWEEFHTTCNAFFEARNAATSGQRNEERDNLDKKRSVIEKLKALAAEKVEGMQEAVQKLSEEYNAIGHVPFKEKDKLYAEYHQVLDEIYKELNVNTQRKRLNNFKNKIKNVAEQGANALDNERTRLMRQYEALKNEIQTYENNLGFLNASSKKGNSLIDELNRKVQKLKDDCALIREKIKAIDAKGQE